MKRIILTLEYDLGDYQDMWDDRAANGDGEPSLTPQAWADSFYQSDVMVHDLKIVAVRVEEGKQ